MQFFEVSLQTLPWLWEGWNFFNKFWSEVTMAPQSILCA